MPEHIAALLEEIKLRDSEIIRLGIELNTLTKANLELMAEIDKLKTRKERE